MNTRDRNDFNIKFYRFLTALWLGLALLNLGAQNWMEAWLLLAGGVALVGVPSDLRHAWEVGHREGVSVRDIWRMS